MPDEISEKPAEKVEKVKEEIDYDKELEEAEKKSQAETFYQKRQEEKKDEEPEEKKDESVDDIAAKVASKILPSIQATVESNIVNAKLEALAKGNESLKKLIKFHLEHSVNPNLDLDSRLEIAYAAANKKRIERAASEINIANQNRAQISNIGGANEEESQKVKDSILSDEQLKELKVKAAGFHFNEKQTETFIQGVRNRLAQSRR